MNEKIWWLLLLFISHTTSCIGGHVSLGHQAISYSHIVDDLSFPSREMKATDENAQIWEQEG